MSRTRRAGEGGGDDRAPVPSAREIAAFRRVVLGHYRAHGRDLAWRHTRDPYAVLVSEVMLQQTQVPRVERMWPRFMEAFPDVYALAGAPLADVLREWAGMGYNRRAVQLKRMAEQVVDRFGGRMPTALDDLLALPGVGPATAAAVEAFAYGEAHPYIETNVRAVFLHHFFGDRCDVPDREIMPLVGITLDRRDPRRWYYALMDYGTHLKRTVPDPCRRSAHHTRQSRFAGSRRELRAALLRAVLDDPGRRTGRYARSTGAAVALAGELLSELAAEGFLTAEDGSWRIA